ncbi:MAG: ATP-binding protein, partial [bacterium]
FLELPAETADAGIDDALATLGRVAGVDRAYVFQFASDLATISNTHEWCAEGIEPERANLQDLSVDATQWVLGRLLNGEIVHLPRVADMPPEAATEKEMLQAQGIQSVLLVPMLSGGRPVGVVGFDSVREEMTWADEDIALLRTVGNIITHALERRRAEEEMRRAERLESLGVLAGGIAHDFSNLLTGILGSLTRARKSLLDTPQVAESLVNAEHAARRARGITRQLLALSTGGAPVKTLAPIGDMVRETAAFALSGSNCRCQLDVADDLWAVEADVDQLSQVVQNLVINADQAMPDGGVIEVTARNVPPDEPGPLRGTRHVELVVRDHGTGIPPRDQARIFDPYFTTKQAGSGLGLAVAHSVVRKHGGRIRVDSQVGAGSTFRVQLPASEAPPPGPPREVPPAERRPGRILVMDDEPVVRKSARWLLADLGYEVTCAADGAAAVELYQQGLDAGRPFDIAILDLTVPGGMGGLECLRRLRAVAPDVTAIVCSGYSTEPVMADFRRHGFRGVILKPFELEDLDAELQRLLAAQDA